MKQRKGDTMIAIVIIVVIILIIIASYFMFFRGTKDENMNDNQNHQIDVYDQNNNHISNENDMSNNVDQDIEILDANAKSFYERVKKGITLNGKLIEVPAEYLTRLTNKIGAKRYRLSDEGKKIVNNKLDEIEKTLKDHNVSDINDLDSATKDKVDSLIHDIEKAL